MIENWRSLSFEERMQTLIKEMAKDYYYVSKIDKIQDAIKIKKLTLDATSPLEFFRIGFHTSIPYHYLEMDIPIVGMEMRGRSIAVGENKALVDYVSKNVPDIQLDKLDFNALIQDTYEKIGSIGAIFYPVDFYTQIHTELNVKFTNDFTIIKTDIGEIKLINSTNFSKWSQIVILGENSIEWTRKLSFNLPPNLSDYRIFSKETDHFQSAYKMDTNEAKFMIGTVSNCRITDPDNIIVYSPPGS
jgi:hypothetical protein